jgi:glutathione peroxidase
VLIVTNVASKCGYTDTAYKGMRQLKETYGKKGLEILAFPCDQFAHQEPGTNEQICEFVQKRSADVVLFDKVKVNGDDTHPVFAFLKKELKGVLNTELIKWNFTKFLIDRTGKPVTRYGPNDSFESMIPEIEQLLSS